MNQAFSFDVKLTLPDFFLKETKFLRQYYYDHPDVDWSIPGNTVNKDIFNLNYPFNEDETLHKLQMDPTNRYIPDHVLDAFDTDVYAMIPPNYFPAFWHYHTYFELIYVLRGTARNYTDNSIFDLKQGDLVILGLGSRHALSSYNDDCVLVNILVRSSTFWEIFSNHTYENDILHHFFTNVLSHYVNDTFILFHTGRDPLIQSLTINLLQTDPSYRKYTELEKKASISLLFSRLMNKYASTSELINNDPTEKNYDIAMILSYMQQHYKEISLSSLAKFFGYSERQTRRLLIKFTGKGYQENLDYIRMAEAKNLLKTTDKSIESIAEDVGFSSVYSFRKSFKHYYKRTPSEYRTEEKIK